MTRSGDFVSGGVLAALGAYIVVQARRWEYLGPDGPGPGFFPLWYGVAMIALAGLLMATSASRKRAAAPAPSPDAAPAEGGLSEIGRPLATWVALAVCVGLLGLLGFLLAFALFTFFMTAVMYRKPILLALAVGVGSALGFYLLFPLALGVSLPTGFLGF